VTDPTSPPDAEALARKIEAVGPNAMRRHITAGYLEQLIREAL
jgi:hypothetical protein